MTHLYIKSAIQFHVPISPPKHKSPLQNQTVNVTESVTMCSGKQINRIDTGHMLRQFHNGLGHACFYEYDN